MTLMIKYLVLKTLSLILLHFLVIAQEAFELIDGPDMTAVASESLVVDPFNFFTAIS